MPKEKGLAKLKKIPLTEAEHVINSLHARLRSRAEQGNARLKVTFEALRRVSQDPWRIGAIAAAALMPLHREHDRTT
ncbi:hypothetical protein SAMN06264364_1652 [Quadrisphaera granulorum]|uniref:DDE superfamily endonuclease n=1 Tax=Quadrisphaera granulorum TaxID=317664 RepID=A0A315ZCB7_9ACTN|nr:hypothetical protein BXY45_1652 [Quadrisphaera granulorum]SZE99217.1 hypothetical protein SAMN06264364_1652 [Quadrisphaera granulorum]